MTTLREAAQQVLEAWQRHQHGECSLGTVVERFDSLRAALAEPEQDGKCTLCTDGCPACDARKLPVQEPVAWISESENLLSWDKFYDHMKPLYAAPPQRKPQFTPKTCRKP